MTDDKKPTLKLNVLVTEVGVNMGDHGQDVTKAIDVDPSTTIGDLMRHVATRMTWGDPKPEWRDDVYVTIRPAIPLPEEAPLDPDEEVTPF